MILSEKYKSDNVTNLITEQTNRILSGINEDTKLIVIVGELGSGKSTLANYIKSNHGEFEILENFEWVALEQQSKKLKKNTKNIVITNKICNIAESIVDSADIIVCTSNKDSKIILDRLKYIAIKEGIKIDEIELVRIVDKYGQDIRGAINHLHNFIK